MIDIDAVFINDVKINSEIKRIAYFNNRIEVPNEKRQLEILDRNKNKASKINQMITTKIYSNIEFRLFFFSCNLEHAMFNKLNLSQDDKEDLMFDYIECTERNEIESHIDRIVHHKHTNDFAHDFKTSWQIMKYSEENIRNTNVNLLISYINFITNK